ncbi:MAG TPA: glycine zipper domain-containing protein [Rhizomicrobium sp.]|jgi:hypothetical protein|nr:glycine zipper domain-containing protein [Rhizomicrobium sp.]
MRTIAKLAVAGALLLGGGTAAYADCNHDTGTETVLGAGAGAAVGGLASHSIAGAVIGGVGGGLIGNAIGQSNNREDCRAEAREYYRERREAYDDRYVEPPPPDGYVDRRGRPLDYPDED